MTPPDSAKGWLMPGGNCPGEERDPRHLERQKAFGKLDYLLQVGKAPHVDIIVVNYNYGRYLKDCLESIAGQTYDNWECTVVDDASTDESLEVIDNFIHDHPERFRHVSNDRNLGQMGGFKVGLENTGAEFVCFVDADDILLPTAVYTHLAAHFCTFTVAFSCSQAVVINKSREVIGGDSQHPGFRRVSTYLHYIWPQPLYTHVWYWSVTSTMMFRRSVLRFATPENTDPFRTCADYYLCHMANLIGGSLLINEPLALYRIHGENALANDSVHGLLTTDYDISRHYDHRTVTLPTMASELLHHKDDLIQILGRKGLQARLVFVADTSMLGDLIRRRKELVFSLGELLSTYLLARATHLVSSILRGVRRATEVFSGFLSS